MTGLGLGIELVLGGLIFLLGMWFLLPLITRVYLTKKTLRICRERGLVVITYDDGPSTDVTPMLLTILNEAGAKATFFMTGSSLKNAPDLAQEVQSNGHLIAVHSMNHVNAYRSAPWTSITDTINGIRTLRKNGLNPQYFRPPYGKATLGTMIAAVFHGCRLTWWTHASGDTGRVPRILNGIIPLKLNREPQLRAPSIDTADHNEWLEDLGQNGGVVLLHDGDRSDVAYKELTLALTKRVIETAQRGGKQLVTVKALHAPYIAQTETIQASDSGRNNDS